MDCSQKSLIYHKQTIVDEDGVILTWEEMNRTIYKTIKVHVEKKRINKAKHTYIPPVS